MYRGFLIHQCLSKARSFLYLPFPCQPAPVCVCVSSGLEIKPGLCALPLNYNFAFTSTASFILLNGVPIMQRDLRHVKSHTQPLPPLLKILCTLYAQPEFKWSPGTLHSEVSSNCKRGQLSLGLFLNGDLCLSFCICRMKKDSRSGLTGRKYLKASPAEAPPR